MMLTDVYDAAISRGEIENNASQRQVLVIMQKILTQLTKRQNSLWGWLQRSKITGLYLYGSVGVGKTYLMDLFFEQVPIKEKRRFHFHQFMQQVDAQLRQLQGQQNPLQRIAAELAKSTRLLCFDEFLVHDIADAMILAELLLALFEQGVVLVATSNTPPDELYLNGLQRARFLPAIAAIKQCCQIIELKEQRDYRLGRQLNLETWFYPINAATEALMQAQFSQLEKTDTVAGDITIQNRNIPFIRCGQRSIWFDFQVICNIPRSQLDYLEIAQRFDTVFVSHVTALRSQDTAAAVLLIHFIDVMYDNNIRIIVQADIPLKSLYTQGEVSQSFKRTYSRLQEMQSEDYLWRHTRRMLSTFN